MIDAVCGKKEWIPEEHWPSIPLKQTILVSNSFKGRLGLHPDLNRELLE
jgi:hypothetical protein